jgi:hypothetical protein
MDNHNYCIFIIGTAGYIGYKFIMNIAAEKLIDRVTQQILTETDMNFRISAIKCYNQKQGCD